MFDDPQTIVGMIFLATLLIIITVFLASKIFKQEPYFQIGLIVGEISFIIIVILNPWWLRIISFVFALVIIALTFFSGIILSRQSVIIGLPSMTLFVYSLLFGRGELWIAVLTGLVFVLGLILSLREMQPGLDMLSKSFPLFAFSLAIVGVFLIPAVFQLMDFLNGVAEIAGSAAGLILYLRTRR
jgi:hypothetical protein